MMFIIIKTFHLISQQFAQVYTPTSDPSYFTPVFTYFPAVFPPVNSQSEVNQPRNPLFSSPPSSSFSFSTSSSFSYPSFSVPHSFFQFTAHLTCVLSSTLPHSPHLHSIFFLHCCLFYVSLIISAYYCYNTSFLLLLVLFYRILQHADCQ